ncbi:MAG: acetylornithine deacetylase [Acidobacteriota bacterium]
MTRAASLLSDADLLARLVAFDSVSHRGNRPIADFVCDYLDRPGVTIERQIAPDGDDARVNLLIHAGPATTPSRAGLTLSGHLDVVPADEPDWTSDPFQLIDADDRYVGRGAADMKGFVALAINRLAQRAAAGDLGAPLALVLTYDEEIGTVGARDFAAAYADRADALPRACVVGEPTSLRAIRLHKGHRRLGLTTAGVPAHSGYPHLGRSAIEPMARVIVALAALRRQLESEPGPHAAHFPAVPWPALNVGTVAGGAAVNVVPARCAIEVGVRALPGMDVDALTARIERAAFDALGDDAAAAQLTMTTINDSPPMQLAEGAPIYRAVCARIDQRDTLSASYATDAGWLAHLGLDCVIWGPGSIEVAHKPDEWMPKDEYARGGALLDRLIGDFCA